MAAAAVGAVGSQAQAGSPNHVRNSPSATVQQREATVLLCVHKVKRRLGLASYDPRTEAVACGSLFLGAPTNMDALRLVRRQFPCVSTLLSSVDTGDELLAALTEDEAAAVEVHARAGRTPSRHNDHATADMGAGSRGDAGGGAGAKRPLLQVLPTRHFKPGVVVRELASLDVVAHHGAHDVEWGDQEDASLLLFADCIDVDDRAAMAALGALVGFMRRTQWGRDGDGGPGASIAATEATSLRVLSLDTLRLDDVMYIDATSLRSLEIFQHQYHPSLLKGPGRAKEGYSLFGLLDDTVTRCGRERLREWMMRPSRDKATILQRQDAIAVLSAPGNTQLCKELRRVLAGASSVERVLARILQARSVPMSWVRLASTISAAISAVQLLELVASPETGAADMLAQLGRAVTPDVCAALRLLSSVFDLPAIRDSKQLVILQGLDANLDMYKAHLESLPRILTRLATRDLQAYPVLDALSYRYVPQLGFLVHVERPVADGATGAAGESETATIMAPEEFELQYEAMDGAYFKNNTTVQLDEEYGDIRSVVTDLENSLVVAVEAQLLECAASLHRVGTALADLDALISLACAAREREYCRPSITSDLVVVVKQGRHPLQELSVDDTFVPNDCVVRGNVVHIVTGPNGGGKSVYLKQIGLITFMAHIGSFVPAQVAIVGLCDRMFTRIETPASVSMAQSAFMVDSRQMCSMIRQSTPQSLLLIDEFGKGTGVLDGIALLGACVDHFLALPVAREGDATADGGRRACPRTVIATHFREMMQWGLWNAKDGSGSAGPHAKVSPFQMQVIVGEDGGGSWRDVVPLFRVAPGVAKESHGMACAANVGVPDGVVDRAREVATALRTGGRLRAWFAEGDTSAAESLTSPRYDTLLRKLRDTDWNTCSDAQVTAMLELINHV